MDSNENIKDYLKKYKKVTIVGISTREERPSFGVSEYLIDQGFEVDGVNPNESEFHSRPVYENLAEVPHPLEIVDVFRAPQHIPQLVEELIPLKPKVLWLQEGVSSPEAEQKARDAGIQVVSNRCILKEHQKLSKTGS